MRKLASLLFATALIAAAPAAAETWRMSGYGGDAPDRTVYLVDTDSISRIGDTVRFKTSTIWENLSDKRDFDRSITTREGNCATLSSAVVANNYYADGELIDASTTRGAMIKHTDGSLMQAVLQAVCGTGEYQSERLPDPEAAVRAWLREG